MFTPEGSARPLSLCYFDIPSINDRSIKSNEIFEALAETTDLKIFNSLSVNIILEKAWQEHRTVFIVFFVAPYCLLLGAFSSGPTGVRSTNSKELALRAQKLKGMRASHLS